MTSSKKPVTRRRWAILGDAAGAQIEEFIFIDLTGSRPVCATDVVGENSRAISALTTLLHTSYVGGLYYPALITPTLHRLDPLWDPLRSDSRFQKLCEEKQHWISPAFFAFAIRLVRAAFSLNGATNFVVLCHPAISHLPPQTPIFR
jgi:hypothetical protein